MTWHLSQNDEMRKSIPNRKLAERRFPFRVDITVPGTGLGTRLDMMLRWCYQNLDVDHWAQHGTSVEAGSGHPRRNVARFYFMTEVDAARFEELWGSSI